MSKNFYTFRGYYLNGLWGKARLRAVVGKPTGIPAAEYELITGEPYACHLRDVRGGHPRGRVGVPSVPVEG